MSAKRVEQALIDRQQAIGPPDLPDLYLVAADVEDWAKRKRVRSVNGAFVDRVNKLRREIEQRRQATQSPAELERYAQLLVELFRMAVSKGWPPADIAKALRAARDHGFPRMNPLVITKLEELGDTWARSEAQG